MHNQHPRVAVTQKLAGSKRVFRFILSLTLLFSSLFPSLALSTSVVAHVAPTTTQTALANSTAQTLDAATKQKAQASFAALPLSIEANQGQVSDPNVKYVARGQNFGVSFAQSGAYIGLSSATNCNAKQPDSLASKSPVACKNNQTNSTVSVVQLSLAGANSNAQLIAGLPQSAKSNYFIGSQSNWHTDIATYGALTYKNVYNGIDVTYSGSRSQLQYAFAVAPGADVSQIHLSFAGADSVKVEKDGSLTIQTKAGSIHQAAPAFYQMNSTTSSRVAVSGRYVSTSQNSIGFSPASYDRSQPLVVAPTLEFATFLGGGGFTYGSSIAVDASGNIYIAGGTGGGLATTSGTYQTASKGSIEAFVAEFNPSASGSASLVYLSYLGGTFESYASGIAVDSVGNIYLAGYTRDKNFPVSATAYQSTNKAYASYIYEAFFTKLNPTVSGASQLVYSTYLGGSNGDVANAIALDGSNNAYIAGYTYSSDFPTSSNAYSTTKTITTSETVFVSKINPSASGNPSLSYSTYLGGSNRSDGNGIAVSNNKIYVTGYTESSDFPTTSNAYQPAYGAGGDAFISELDPTQTGSNQLVYSTYLGGSSEDYSKGITVSNGKIYVTGYTLSSNFPTTSKAYQPAFGGNYDVFISELDPTQTGSNQLVYSTYLGGNNSEHGYGIAVSNGKIYVTGYTLSSNFPISGDAYQATNANEDEEVFVTELDPTQTGSNQLVYSSYLGGDSYQEAYGIVVDSAGNIYLSGYTYSYSGPGATGFPTTSNAYQTNSLSLGSSDSAFVTKLNPNAGSIASQLVYSSYLGGNSGSEGTRVATDSAGNVYVTGFTGGSFPTTISTTYQSSYSGSTDVYVVELNPTLTTLLYSSYLGGNYEDESYGLAVDNTGNIYIAGYTYSNALTNTVGGSNVPFPTTSTAYQTVNNGGSNDESVAFLTRLNPQASGSAQLIYSTFFGGSHSDSVQDIAVDNNGHAYITGYTYSPDFPITANAYQITSTAVLNNQSTGFVSKFDTNASGSASLLYSSYFGSLGSGYNGDQGNSIAIDSSSNVYLTGYTYSSDFPTTINAIEPIYNAKDNDEAFVSKLNLAASGAAQLLYSSYLGTMGPGSGDDAGYGIAVDSNGNAYVTGVTNSTDFITTTNAYQTTYGGKGDAFLTVISPTAATGSTSLLYSTYLGGNSNDVGMQVKVDANGNAFITGYSYSNNLTTTVGSGTQSTNTPYPTTANAFQSTNNAAAERGANAILSKLNTKASGAASLLYSTYLGGSNISEEDDTANALALDPVGSPSVTGLGDSPDFPGVASGYQPSPGGVFSGFAAKLVLNSLSFSTQPIAGLAGQSLTTQPIVMVLQPDGTTAYNYNGPVTITIKSGTGTGGAVLSGTTTVNAVNGVATFTNLSINLGGTGYQLVASVINNLLPSVSSTTFNVTAVTPPTYTYYLPFVANNANSFTTYLAFQNVGSATANVNINYYGSNGVTLTNTSVITTVAQYGETLPPNPLASGATGAGIITSDQPLNVIVPEATPYGGSAYAVPSGSSNSLIAPFALNNAFGDFTTQLNVFNGGSSAVTATVTFYGTVGNSTTITSSTTSLNIGAHQTTNLNQNTLPSGFSGWAQISGSANTLVAQVLEQSPSQKFVAIANAIANPSSTEYAPAVFNGGYGSFYTGANIINPNSSAVTVTVTYYDLSANATATTPFAIPAFGVASIFDGAASGNGLPSGGLPSNFVGSVAVSAVGGNVAMSVNENGGVTATGNSRSGTYAAIANGGSTVGLPVISNGGYTYTTGTTIQNTSSQLVTATITYYNINGTSTGVSKSFTVAGHGSQAYYQGDGTLPSNFYGAAVITETGGSANSLIATTNAQSSSLFYTYSEPNS